MLGHRIEHVPEKLSDGERQRVAIARALVTNPDVVFADEPTGNLDTKSGSVIMGMLQKLNDQGRTIIVITHEREIALHTKRIVYIRDGEVESDKEVKEKERLIASES